MKAVIISDCVYNRLNNYLSYIVETPDTTYNVSPSRAFEKWNELINALVKKLGNGLVSYPRTKYSQLGKSIGCKQFNYIMSKTNTQFCFGYLEDNDCVLVCYMENSSMVKNEAVDRVCNYNMKSNSEDKDNHSYCVLNPNQIKYISNKTFSDSPNMYKDKQHNTMNNTKKRIRLTESQLHNIINKCVKNVMNESNYWTYGNENGPFEFGGGCGYPTEKTYERGYIPYYDDVDDYTERVRKQSAEPWQYDYLAITPFAKDDRDAASEYVRSGNISDRDFTREFPGYREPYHADNDIEQFNQKEIKKNVRNFQRALDAADKRSLHRKNSLNRDLEESIRRAIRKALR